MSPPWIVMKFGGTSVATEARWSAIADAIRQCRQEGRRPLVVCSAMSGITNLLESLIDAALHGEHEPVLQELRTRHRELASELGVDPDATVGDLLDELERLALGISLVESVSPPLQARILSAGELMSTRLGVAYLQKTGLNATWLDARELLQATEAPRAQPSRRYLAAACDFAPDARLQEQLAGEAADVLLTQGFIARNEADETVLIGRGGSDTSAAYLAAKLQAERLEIWTDVPGLFTANPRLIPSARLLRQLGYEEAQELATMGAKVLHPRCIKPVREHDIPLHIRCTTAPEIEGTVVSQQSSGASAQVKALSSKTGVRLVSMSTLGMWQQVGFLADVFSVFKEHGLSIDLVATSETDVTVSLDPTANALDEDVLDALLLDLNRYCTARTIGPCAVVSLVGKNIRSILHELGPTLEVFDQQQVHLVSQAASDLNLSFVVEEDQAERILRRLHAQLFGTRPPGTIFGPSWNLLFERPTATDEARPWWEERREQLLHLVEEQSPVYVYDEATLQQTARRLKSVEAVDRFFYSVKANPHPALLQGLAETGIGFECVSPEELAHVRQHLPELAPERLLFTPNFAARNEYAAGFDAGAYVTLDSLHPLEHWPEVFEGHELLIRVDPGEGRGHHRHVRTGGARSKFGIVPEKLERVRHLAEEAGARIIGLHAHQGSGITTPETWARLAALLAEWAAPFPDVRILDVGGGLGVPERPDARSLDLSAVAEQLAAVRQAHPEYELWMEPGRYLVAEAGVLLARVTQLKEKGQEAYYVGLDTGMNSLLRPALYGAYHEIVNLTRLGTPDAITADVVGPICETGDVLGHSRRLPETREGDCLLIATAGAYGHAMSSHYNLRPPASEAVLPTPVEDAA